MSVTEEATMWRDRLRLASRSTLVDFTPDDAEHLARLLDRLLEFIWAQMPTTKIAEK